MKKKISPCRHHAGSVHCLFPIVTSLGRSQKRVSCSKSAAGLLLAVIKPISGCVGIACSGLMVTSLLQVVNRLAASWLSKLFIHKLEASCSTTRSKPANIKTQQVWFLQTCYNLLTTCRKPVKPQLAALTVKKVVKDLLQVVPRVCRNCGNMSAKTMEKIVKKAKSTS